MLRMGGTVTLWDPSAHASRLRPSNPSANAAMGRSPPPNVPVRTQTSRRSRRSTSWSSAMASSETRTPQVVKPSNGRPLENSPNLRAGPREPPRRHVPISVQPLRNGLERFPGFPQGLHQRHQKSVCVPCLFSSTLRSHLGCFTPAALSAFPVTRSCRTELDAPSLRSRQSRFGSLADPMSFILRHRRQYVDG